MGHREGLRLGGSEGAAASGSQAQGSIPLVHDQEELGRFWVPQMLPASAEPLQRAEPILREVPGQQGQGSHANGGSGLVFILHGQFAPSCQLFWNPCADS